MPKIKLSCNDPRLGKLPMWVRQAVTLNFATAWIEDGVCGYAWNTCSIGEVTIAPPENKQYVGLVWIRPEGTKEDWEQAYEWKNPDGTPCYTTDIEGLNLININEYEMSNIAGNVIPENLAKLTTQGCVTICIPAASSITLADVLAEGVADGILLPDATAPTGFLLDSIMSFSIGQLGKDAAGATKKAGAQVVHYDTDESINAGSTYCSEENQVLTDDDCDRFLKGSDLTRTIENPSATEAAIVRVCGSFIPLDADDADAGVQ